MVGHSVYSRLAGYEDTNDAERLAHHGVRSPTGQDSTIGVIVGRRLTALVTDTKMAVVEDGALPGSGQDDMGNSGLSSFSPLGYFAPSWSVRMWLVDEHSELISPSPLFAKVC